MNKPLSSKIFFVSCTLILILSLAFLAGLYFILNSDQFLKSALQQTYRPVTTKPISFSLEIGSPDDETLVFEKDILISGRTNPKATIIITTDGYTGLTAGAEGEFSKVVELKPGLNEITVAGFDEKGNYEVITRTIYYSKEKI